MSASAAASASSSPPERVVAFIGPMGSGKSFLINKFRDANVAEAVSIDSNHRVTASAKSYRGRDGFTLIDTVGVNKSGHASGFPQQMVEGKLVHFVLLLTSLRWEDELESIRSSLDWARLNGNISWWAGHKAAFVPGEEGNPQLSSKLELANLTFAAGPPMKMQRVAFASSSVSAQVHPVISAVPGKKKVKPQRSRSWNLFGKEKESLSPRERILYDIWTGTMNWAIPAQNRQMPAEAWRALQTPAEISTHRRTGEKLLEWHLLLLEGSTNFADNDALLAVLDAVDCKPSLRQHIKSIHQIADGTPEPNPETYGNYVEALFQHIMTTPKMRKFAVAFLKAVCRGLD